MKITKKILSMVLTLAMLLSLLPATVLAVDGFTATIEDGNVNAGESITVDVTLSNNPGFANFELGVQYDSSKLTLTAIGKGSILTDGSFVKNPAENIVTFANAEDMDANGQVFTLTFTANASASGDTSVTLVPISTASALKNYGFSNVDDSEVPVTFVAGTISITGSTQEHTVTFMDGKTQLRQFTVSHGAVLTAEQIPTLALLEGWYTDAAFNTKANLSASITADATFYAKTLAAGTVVTLTRAEDGTVIGYNDLQSAISAALTGDTIKLVADIENYVSGSYMAQIKSSASLQSLTLDLNGHKLTSANQMYITASETNFRMNLIDSVGTGKISAAEGATKASLIQTEGTSTANLTLNMTGVTIQKMVIVGSIIQLNGYTTLNLEGCHLESDPIGSNIERNYSAIKYSSEKPNNIVTITDSKVIAHNRNSYAISGDWSGTGSALTITGDNTVIEGGARTISLDNSQGTYKFMGGTYRQTGGTYDYDDGMNANLYADCSADAKIIISGGTWEAEGSNLHFVCYNADTPSCKLTDGKFRFGDGLFCWGDNDEMLALDFIKGVDGYYKLDNGTVTSHTIKFIIQHDSGLDETVSVKVEDGVVPSYTGNTEFYASRTLFCVTGWSKDKDGKPVDLRKETITEDTIYYAIVDAQDLEHRFTYTFKDGATYDGYGWAYDTDDIPYDQIATLTLKSDFEGLVLDGSKYTTNKPSFTLDLNGTYQIGHKRDGEPVHALTINNMDVTITGSGRLNAKSKGTYSIYATGASKIVLDGDFLLSALNNEYAIQGDDATLEIRHAYLENLNSRISCTTLVGTYAIATNETEDVYVDEDNMSYGGYRLYATKTVIFKNGDIILQSEALELNTAVTAPTETPTKGPAGNYTYTFSGWNDGTKTYAANALPVVTHDVTYTAVFDAHYQAPAVEPDESGKVSQDVTDQTFEAGSSNTLDLKSGSKDATEAEITLDNATANSVAETKELTIATDVVEFTFDEAALKNIGTAAGASESIKLSAADNTDKRESYTGTKKTVLSAMTKVFELTLKTGSDTAVDFKGSTGGKVLVSIPYTKQSTGTPTVWYVDDEGVKTNMNATYTAGCLRFFTDHFSTYAVDDGGNVAADYTLTAAVTDADKNYNPGETVTVNITATSTDAGANFGSFGFKLDYDSAKLELTNVSTSLNGNLDVNKTAGDAKCGTVGYSGGSEAIGSGIVIATATFKVKTSITTSMNEDIALTNAEMTPYGVSANTKTPTVVGDTVNLYNLKVTFASGSNTTFGASDATVAYVKYGEAGLFTDDTYANDFIFPTPTANAGYRLANKTGENLWSDGANGYADNAAVSAATFTADTTLTVQTVKTSVISFGTPVNGSYTNGTPAAITVDTDTALSDVTLPAYTANTGYEFVAWNDGTSNIDVATYTVTGDITLTPKFAAKTFNWSYTETTGVTMSELTGVTDGKVTYGQNVTFKLTPATDYVITNVAYAVGTNAAEIITADESGVYTIPGTALLGNVTLEVTVNHYHKVIFQAGTGTTVTETTLYVRDNVAGLFTDPACTTVGTVPTVAAQEGYRLAADTAAEPLWSGDNGTNYTSASIAQAQLTADVTLTAQAVKQYTVTFAVADSTQASLSGTTSFKVDTGKAISTGGTTPTIAYNDGYTFDKWMIGSTEYASDAEMLAAVVTSDVSVTLHAKDASYAITLNAGSAATITDITGVTDSKATHGTNVTFKLTPNAGYKVTEVAYKIGTGTPVAITESNGVYTIPGDAITDSVTLVLTSNETYTITFAAGENGTVSGTISFTLDKGSKLTSEQLDAVIKTGNPGYTFKEWQIGGTTKTDTEIIDTAFDTATTITAIFDHGTYTVTLPDGMSNNGSEVVNATHGTNLTITPTLNGSIVTGLSYKVGEGEAQALIVNADGSYTIPGDAIIGDITITATTVTGTIDFITAENYKALAAVGDTQIAVLNTAKLTDSKYTLADGTEFYWSSKYNAYVKIVASSETAQTIAAKLKTATGDAVAVDYSGDLNGNGSVTPADAGCVNYILQQSASFVPTDLQRLACDVTGDKTVSTDDVVWVLKKYTGTNS